MMIYVLKFNSTYYIINITIILRLFNFIFNYIAGDYVFFRLILPFSCIFIKFLFIRIAY